MNIDAGISRAERPTSVRWRVCALIAVMSFVEAQIQAGEGLSQTAVARELRARLRA
ncbi:MAG: hypothetical protein M3Q93_00410 [Gemmatimonadota bacterium]|nr:hypothetical protein [Gemmatimonadota bacterium]